MKKKTLNQKVTQTQYIVRVNEKGQVSIPKALRLKMGIVESSMVPMTFNEEHGLNIKKVESVQDMRKRLRELRNKMLKYTEGIPFRTAEQIRNNMTQKEIEDEVGGLS